MKDLKSKKSKPKVAGGTGKKRQTLSDPISTALSAETDETFHQILSILHHQTKIDVSQYKFTTINRRIQRQMKIHRLSNIDEYLKYLETWPEAVKALCDDIFIHVTEFFRDPESFDALKEQVFSSLFKTRIPGVPLRIWVPGCSTGEEAYSLAISLLELAKELNEELPFQIFATDISEKTVEEARSGFYTDGDIEGLSEVRLTENFEKVKGGYKVKRQIRDLCVFSRHDLTRNPPFAKIDLISCRNVLIYFASELQQQVMPVFHYALNPTGFLWLGRSEVPSGISKLFSLRDKTHKIFSKITSASPMSFQFPYNRITEKVDLSRKPNHKAPLITDHQKEVDRIAAKRYAPAGAVINSDFEIIQVRGHTAPFLELPSGQPSYNLLKMVRPELLPGIRLALQAAQKQNAPARKEGLTYKKGGGQKKITIEIIPINPSAKLKDRQYLIFFEEPDLGGKKKAPQKTTKTTKLKEKRQTDIKEAYASLLKELDSLREYQQSVSEGYEEVQDELTSSNEELHSTLEEFQSTNEELEAAKEELQAANEELRTVNDELQHRNEDLITLNEQLTKSEERFKFMVEGVKDYAIFMLDPEGRIATWNEGARRIKGYEAEEIIGKFFSVFYTAPDLESKKPQRELEIAKKEGRYEEEGWRLRKDGSTFWANVLITRINNREGKLLGFSKVTRDLTERKKAEEELKLSEARFRLIVSSVKEYAILMLDPTGQVRSWNEGAERLKGYTASEIIGQHFSKFYPPEDVKAKKPERELEIATAKGSIEDEGWRVRKDGARFWANTIITRISDEHGKVLGFSKVTRDLTDRMKASLALQEANESLESRVKVRTAELAEALNARDEFLSIASHELKTPLTSLKLQLQIAQRRKDTLDSAQISKLTDTCLKQMDSVVTLVDDLLDVSKIQTGNFQLFCEKFDLSVVASDVASRFNEQFLAAGIPLELSFEKNLAGFWDRHRLEQVLTNLISNAIKYAPRAPLQISLKKTGKTAIFTIKDNGPGIEKEKQQKIFERFERANVSRNVGGLGLGLFIVRRIVEAHGGKVSVESDLGQGSKFRVELPLDSCPEDLDWGK